MAQAVSLHALTHIPERVGRATFGALAALVRGVAELGYATILFGESMFWLAFGKVWRQPVRLPMVIEQMMEVGIRALPIGTVLALVIGVTLAMQGIDLLKTFGAQSQVVLAVALSVTREFAPLIMGILVAGRSGSALAARLGTMTNSQEIDALRVMGINPVRFLVVPSLVAMVIMLPALTVWADLMALLGAATYTYFELGLSFAAYTEATLSVLSVAHVMHGVGKSIVFAALIALVGVVNGLLVEPGAQGVGRAATRAVVISIAGIIITDMLFILVVIRAGF